MSEIDPDLHTPMEDYSAAEKAKMSTRGLSLAIQDVSSPANLRHQFKDSSFQELADVAETLAKSYGIYLDFDRAKTGQEKDWMYMLRITIPGGGPLTGQQWAILDDVAEKYTGSDLYTGKVQPSLRVTTRQNVQLHWIKKKDVIDAVSEIAKSGFYTINGCGDNVRNVMGCPISHYSKVFDANAWAQKVGTYFRLPTAAYIEIFQIDPNYLRDERTAEERFQVRDQPAQQEVQDSVLEHPPRRGDRRVRARQLRRGADERPRHRPDPRRRGEGGEVPDIRWWRSGTEDRAPDFRRAREAAWASSRGKSTCSRRWTQWSRSTKSGATGRTGTGPG